jgi:hypothetical protein
LIDRESRIMAAILFLITYETFQNGLKYIRYVPLIISQPILAEFRKEGARNFKIQIRDCSLLQMLTKNLTRHYSIYFLK